MIKNEQGYSLVEMTVVMLLLVVFGLGIFMLAATTTTTYRSLVEDKSNVEQLRVASSFITTKIRQNDRQQGLFVLTDSQTFGDVLLAQELYGDDYYTTWIYVSNGFLREATVPTGMIPTDDSSFEIAKIDTFKLYFDDNWLSFDLWKAEKTVKGVSLSTKSTVRPFE